MDNVFIVLVRPAISGNVGAVARAMGNFSFSKLILVDAKCIIDEEARNRAKHAQKILDSAIHKKTLKEALLGMSMSVATTGITGTDFNIPRSPLLATDAATKILSTKSNVAIVFGAEDTGLSNDEIELCDFTATIPSSKKYPVLNLSHAVSIMLYDISKQNLSGEISSRFPMIAGKEKEALEKLMDDVIESVQYRTEFEKRTQKLVWKRIIGKAAPTRREAFAMMGLLKKLSINNKLNAETNAQNKKKLKIKKKKEK